MSVLNLYIEHAGWRRISGLRKRLETAARATLEHLPRHRHASCSITLLLTGNAAMRRLNRDFRGMDRSTNVLSFPQFEPSELPKKGRKGQDLVLGDIVMACQYIVAEAKRDHKILKNHIVHLLIHGILHLFGYDHLSDRGAARMERLEQRIMASLGLPDPYAPAKAAARKK